MSDKDKAENGLLNDAEKSDQSGGGSNQLATSSRSDTVVPTTSSQTEESANVALKNRLLTLLTLSVSDSNSGNKSLELSKQKSHQFWNSQPVPKFDDEDALIKNEPLIPDEQVKDVRSAPYKLPEGFQWSEIDSESKADMTEIYHLLSENYVEDNENMFRFDYSIQFLKWALKPPGWQADWFIGVRVSKTKKLVGFISAIPALIHIFDKVVQMVEINFLCVHKKLREKRMAPVLIREITRRVNLKHIYQAVYTAGVVLPKPIGSCCYWHRSLNPKKLIEAKFSQLGRNMTLQRAIKLYKLPKETATPGLRRMVESDASQVQKMLDEYLKRFDLAPRFNVEECVHWFTPREDVIDSYVVEKNGQVTDFFSYYTLPSSIMHHPIHKCIKAAYLFYCVANATPMTALIGDALIMAKNKGFDVFNALDLMENGTFLEQLKFGVGDGHLQYYLYNWRCPELKSEKIGLILQ